MAQDKKHDGDYLSAADKALLRFTELMIDKIQTLQGDWKKPWFTPGTTQPPQNLSGRHYNGGNSLMLMMQAEKMGYDIPVWATFDRITNLNYIKDKHGNVFQARDENNNKLPQVSVNKGEKSFPVFLTTFTVVNPETKEKIQVQGVPEAPGLQRVQRSCADQPGVDPSPDVRETQGTGSGTDDA